MTATVTACWADVLDRAERHALADKLMRACSQYPEAIDELNDLYADVTEREAETEVIATFEHAGKTYEIDHLGIRMLLNWGEFAVYRDGAMVGEFAIPESEFPPGELPAAGELIALAIGSLQED